MRSIPQATHPNPDREGNGPPTYQLVIAASFSQQRRSVNDSFSVSAQGTLYVPST